MKSIRKRSPEKEPEDKEVTCHLTDSSVSVCGNILSRSKQRCKLRVKAGEEEYTKEYIIPENQEAALQFETQVVREQVKTATAKGKAKKEAIRRARHIKEHRKSIKMEKNEEKEQTSISSSTHSSTSSQKVRDRHSSTSSGALKGKSLGANRSRNRRQGGHKYLVTKRSRLKKSPRAKATKKASQKKAKSLSSVKSAKRSRSTSLVNSNSSEREKSTSPVKSPEKNGRGSPSRIKTSDFNVTSTRSDESLAQNETEEESKDTKYEVTTKRGAWKSEQEQTEDSPQKRSKKSEQSSTSSDSGSTSSKTSEKSEKARHEMTKQSREMDSKSVKAERMSDSGSRDGSIRRTIIPRAVEEEDASPGVTFLFVTLVILSLLVLVEGNGIFTACDYLGAFEKDYLLSILLYLQIPAVSLAACGLLTTRKDISRLNKSVSLCTLLAINYTLLRAENCQQENRNGSIIRYSCCCQLLYGLMALYFQSHGKMLEEHLWERLAVAFSPIVLTAPLLSLLYCGCKHQQLTIIVALVIYVVGMYVFLMCKFERRCRPSLTDDLVFAENVVLRIPTAIQVRYPNYLGIILIAIGSTAPIVSLITLVSWVLVIGFLVLRAAKLDKFFQSLQPKAWKKLTAAVQSSIVPCKF